MIGEGEKDRGEDGCYGESDLGGGDVDEEYADEQKRCGCDGG